MNCKATEKLLALYVGDDLPARQARRVALHLDSCSKCEKLAGEFGASVAFSRSNAAPEFDSNFFDDLRRDVLTRIAPQPQTHFTIFAKGLVPRRMGYAYGLALASALCLFASYAFIKQSPRLQHSECAGVSARENKVNESARASSTQSLGLSVAHVSQPPTIVTINRITQRNAAAKALLRSRSTDSLTFISDKDYTARQAIVSRSLSTQDLAETGTTNGVLPNDVIASGNETGEANAESATGAASVESAVTGAEMFRMEIQTSDPTLRIIWLSPKTQNAPTVKTNTQGS